MSSRRVNRRTNQPIVKKDEETVKVEEKTTAVVPASVPAVVAESSVPTAVPAVVPIPVSIKSTPVTIHDLPHHYRTMKFDYRFRDNVKHGLPHSSRGKDLKLTAHIPTLKGSHPSSYSLRQFVGKILNQLQLGSCVSNSMSQALYIVMNRGDSNRWMMSRLLSSGSAFYGSRLFIYDNARRIDGTPLSEDTGTTNISACLSVNEYKVCDESLWPYIETNYDKIPPHSAYLAAGNYTTFKYSVVDQSADAIKRAIASGHPVLFGIVVYPSFIQAGLNGNNGDVNFPHADETPVGGHSLLAVGFDDNTKRFTFVNHWGPEWSDGYGTLPYGYLENSDYSGDFCAIEKFC